MTRTRTLTVLTGALTALIALAMPVVVVGTALWIAVNPWLVDLQYALPGFPADAQGLGGQDRTDLAIAGLRSVRPLDDGMQLLREARLPDGTAAFTEREISHMSDVRGVVSGFIVAWAIALPVLIAAALVLSRVRTRAVALRAIGWGGVFTIALVAFVGIGALIDFDGFFTIFHTIFFEGNTWRFEYTDTLLRLYPEMFWTVATGLIIVLIVVQAAGAALLLRRGRRAKV